MIFTGVGLLLVGVLHFLLRQSTLGFVSGIYLIWLSGLFLISNLSGSADAVLWILIGVTPVFVAVSLSLRQYDQRGTTSLKWMKNLKG